MMRGGKGGKPRTGFPPFPPRLEIAGAIPTFPPVRRRISLLAIVRTERLRPAGAGEEMSCSDGSGWVITTVVLPLLLWPVLK